MNIVEKAVLENLVDTLEQSTHKSWERGDVWAEYAKEMRITINNSVGVMKALLKTPIENMEEK